VPSKQANVKNEKQYEAPKDKGMSKQRSARIANAPDASSQGGRKSGSGGNAKQGGTAAQQGRRPQRRPCRRQILTAATAGAADRLNVWFGPRQPNPGRLTTSAFRSR
jgi:hypothetical protein